MLATEDPTHPEIDRDPNAAPLETQERNERMRHVPTADWMVTKLQNDLRKRLETLWTPYAELYHHESATRGAEDTVEKRDRFRSEVEYMTAKWGDALVNDPAYNPNLTLTLNDFTPALPPRPWPPLN